MNDETREKLMGDGGVSPSVESGKTQEQSVAAPTVLEDGNDVGNAVEGMDDTRETEELSEHENDATKDDPQAFNNGNEQTKMEDDESREVAETAVGDATVATVSSEDASAEKSAETKPIEKQTMDVLGKDDFSQNRLLSGKEFVISNWRLSSSNLQHDSDDHGPPSGGLFFPPFPFAFL